MSSLEQDRRVAIRSTLSTSAVVKGRESTEVFWKEETEIINVSRVGGSFNLTRECPAGRLVSIMMKMPKHLRGYDRDKKLYRVWGLVQHCRPISGDDFEGYQIGVAFVGKHAPKSYIDDPLKSYRVSGMDQDGFWSIGETKTPFVSRAYHRFTITLEAKTALLDSDENEIAVDEEAVTENVGAGGASVFSNLEANIGDAVKFTCPEYDFSSLCVVRNRQRWEEGRTTLHLEFAQSDFPVKDLAHGSDNVEKAEDAEEIESLEEPTDANETEGDQLLEIEHHSEVVGFREIEKADEG